MTVRKRGGSWHYDLMIESVRYRGAIQTARTKSQAEHAEAKVRLEIHEGKYGRPQGTRTLDDFVEKVYTPWAKANKKSWKIDISRLKPILAFFGKKKLSEVSPFLIEKYKIQRRAAPVISKNKSKPRMVASVNRELRLLSRIFRLAVSSKEAAENPCREVKILKGEQHRTRYLLPEEEGRLMTTLTGERSHLCDMVTLAINTGLRVNELFGLKREDVDFHRDVLYIKHTKTDEDREVPLNDTARELLRELMQADRMGGEFLFTNPKTGTRYTTIKTAWLTACRNAGLTNLRFHDLRHTFGTRAADAGVPLPAIRDVMGHRSIQTTERYAHATDEGKRRAVEAIGRQSQKIVTKLSQRKAANR